MPRSAHRRRLLVAPDSFKGTFSAPEVAAAIARGVRAADCEATVVPLADGGEGTADVIYRSLGGDIVPARVDGPLGDPVTAEFVMLPGRATAVLDSAAASGLPLVDPRQLDPLGASTAGTGELIVAAVAAGASRVCVAAGGSATTDGGVGAIEVIQASGGLRGASLTVLCDVRTPFEQAAAVFAPQKGASPEQVALLTSRMESAAKALPRDPRGIPMTGCAGGLSGGLWATFEAELVPGAEFVFHTVGLAAHLPLAQAVISGEGGLDAQSLDGKVVGELARLCTKAGVPLHAVVGHDGLDAAPARAAGIESVREAQDEDALEHAGRAIANELRGQ